MLNEKRVNQEGRIVSIEFQKVFLVNVWVENDYDNFLLEWQFTKENKDKSIPLLLFLLLSSQKRNVIKEYYNKRYNDKFILPEWDCVPLYQELGLFVQNEGYYFEERFGLPIDSLFDKNWENTVDGDYCFCDFEMFPVTQLLISSI